jgi:dsDNA-specific endonuclease/ATPase MutS2
MKYVFDIKYDSLVENNHSMCSSHTCNIVDFLKYKTLKSAIHAFSNMTTIIGDIEFLTKIFELCRLISIVYFPPHS